MAANIIYDLHLGYTNMVYWQSRKPRHLGVVIGILGFTCYCLQRKINLLLDKCRILLTVYFSF